MWAALDLLKNRVVDTAAMEYTTYTPNTLKLFPKNHGYTMYTLNQTEKEEEIHNVYLC